MLTSVLAALVALEAPSVPVVEPTPGQVVTPEWAAEAPRNNGPLPVAPEPHAQPAQPGPFVLRGRAEWQAFHFVGLGVEGAWIFHPNLVAEASLTGVDLSRGLWGTIVGGGLRAGHFGRHSVSAGAGVDLLSSPDFGEVAFFVPEIAYEYRGPGGFSFAVGTGLPVTLNQSREVPCESPGILGCFLEVERFHRGDVSLRFRLALGYSF